MRNFCEENERIKREYLTYLREAKGQDETSLQKTAAALLVFEEAVCFKPFKSFNREWATKFKKHLKQRKQARTGMPLGIATRDATLRLVKRFVEWLSTQPAYRRRISYSDAAYFNNNAREARAAHAQRLIAYPSLDQCDHAFRKMPNSGIVERRDKAVFAYLMLTGARIAAVASMRLGLVDLVEGCVLQDSRVVKTKNGKTIQTTFNPVDPMFRENFEAWVNYLREDLRYGPTDALFPKQEHLGKSGRFGEYRLSREPYSNGDTVTAIFKAAFRAAGLPEYSAHSLRKTFGHMMDKTCENMEERKAWSQNMGHEQLATTVTAYMPISTERQREIMRSLGSRKQNTAK